MKKEIIVDLHEYTEEVKNGLKSGDSKLEKWWWGVSTKELAIKLKTYTDEQVASIASVKDSKGLQARQVELAKRELERRKKAKETKK